MNFQYAYLNIMRIYVYILKLYKIYNIYALIYICIIYIIYINISFYNIKCIACVIYCAASGYLDICGHRNTRDLARESSSQDSLFFSLPYKFYLNFRFIDLNLAGADFSRSRMQLRMQLGARTRRKRRVYFCICTNTYTLRRERPFAKRGRLWPLIYNFPREGTRAQ